MDLPHLLLAAAPWVGGALGLAFSAVVIGGLAVIVHQAGLFYLLPKWAMKGFGAFAVPR